MEFIILKDIKKAIFTVVKVSSPKMEAIGQFLVFDVACFADYFKNKLQVPLIGFTANSCLIEKEKGWITITDLFDESWTITLPSKKLIELLEKWGMLLNLLVLPDKASILMDNDYNFEIKYEADGVEKVI